MTAWTPYLRFPSLHVDPSHDDPSPAAASPVVASPVAASPAGSLRATVAFAAEDDVWLAPVPAADGEPARAWRLTADEAPVAGVRLSPDGAAVAFTSRRDGAPEVTVVLTEPGAEPARRLTWWGEEATRVLGWTADGRVLAVSAVGQPFRDMTWAYAVPLDGGRPERLPHGPITGYAAGPGGALVLGVRQSSRSAASWKRYRGGTAGALWIDPDGTGTFVPFLTELRGQLEDPVWTGGRLAFLSDHEGWGNVYSVAPPADRASAADPADLRRHSDHGDAYARAMTGDGSRLVYASRGDLWLVDTLAPEESPRRLEIRLGGGGAGRRPAPIRTADALGELAADRDGRASAVEVRGSVHWLTHRDGPARALVDVPGVRARLPRVAAAPGGPVTVVAVTDAEGDDALEVVPVEGDGERRRLAAGRLGRVLDLAVAPDGTRVAAAAHDGRVLTVDVASGEVRELDRSPHGDATGLAFSPDSAWLAWSHAGPSEALRQIRMARVAGGEPEVVEVTRLRFADTEPVFTPDGRHLAFLSTRTFDPVYDAHVFEMAFPTAIRPYLLPLAADTPSPFDPQLRGRPAGSAEEGDRDQRPPGTDGAPPEIPAVRVDLDGLDLRVVPVPVAAGRLSHLQAARDALLWLEEPLTGELGDALAPGSDRPRPALRRYDLRTVEATTLVDEVDAAAVTADGSRVVVRDRSAVRVLPADRPVKEPDDAAKVDVDLDRLRLRVDPVAMWQQMFDENGRLMRDHFWVADFAGVDWEGVLARYRPLVARLGSRDDLSEVLWEVMGELGTSHAYETRPPRPVDGERRVGHLGVDLAPDGEGRWRVTAVVPGEPSVPAARSPLQAPGVVVRPGDAVVAVDGRPVDARTGPGPLLVGSAGVPIEITVEGGTPGAAEGGLPGAAEGGAQGPAEGGDAREGRRRFAVRPLPDERPLRYHAWVADRRRAVHELGGGRVGYLHIPNMMAVGWAELHRDLHVEVARDALVVDVRHNGGGHVSQLVLERLARTVRGWDVVRHRAPETYPADARRGPLVAIADEWAGSDGDIVTAGFKALRLGPVVGKRTWGGVVGIDARYSLVDGTGVTQPRYAFWFPEHGWGVENHGVDPDVEVEFAPQDWAAGRDPQLETAVRLALEALADLTPPSPPDPATRPDRSAPTLPPRP